LPTNGDARDRELDREIERYRAASTPALERLEWIVAYLTRSGSQSS
jgi:hypothetical protein